jgi:hypothetical protein
MLAMRGHHQGRDAVVICVVQICSEVSDQHAYDIQMTIHGSSAHGRNTTIAEMVGVGSEFFDQALQRSKPALLSCNMDW